MKKLLSIFFIFLITGISSKAHSQVLFAQKLSELVKQEQQKELIEKDYKDFEVNVLNIPFEKVVVPDGEISIKLNSNSAELTSKEYKKVDIYINSKYERSVGVPVEIKIYKTILTAKEQIQRDCELNKNNTVLKKYDILTVMQVSLDEKDIESNLISLRMYRPGEIIDKRFTKLKPDISKNSVVTVVFKSDNNMNVTIDAVALSDGKIGNLISVQNKIYKKIYTGRVVGPNKILVEI